MATQFNANEVERAISELGLDAMRGDRELEARVYESVVSKFTSGRNRRWLWENFRQP